MPVIIIVKLMYPEITIKLLRFNCFLLVIRLDKCPKIYNILQISFLFVIHFSSFTRFDIRDQRKLPVLLTYSFTSNIAAALRAIAAWVAITTRKLILNRRFACKRSEEIGLRPPWSIVSLLVVNQKQTWFIV